MDKLFSNIKKIHLYSSFVILSFLLLFFISGAVMFMPNLFPRKALKITNEKSTVYVDQPISDMVTNLRRIHNIHGKEIVNETGNQKNFTYKRPGYRAEINFKKGEDTVRIKITENNFASSMNDFHRLHGYEGNWINKCWALMYDLCCLSLVAFAFTGVYLWWKLEKKKLYGLIFFLSSTVLTIFAIWYLLAIG